jgi:hypothetical protein
MPAAAHIAKARAAKERIVIDTINCKGFARLQELADALGLQTKQVENMLRDMRAKGLVYSEARDRWVVGSVKDPAIIESAKRRRQRQNEAARRKRSRQDIKARNRAKQEREYSAWLHPVKRTVSIWTAQIPRGAVRSVFELASA